MWVHEGCFYSSKIMELMTPSSLQAAAVEITVSPVCSQKSAVQVQRVFWQPGSHIQLLFQQKCYHNPPEKMHMLACLASLEASHLSDMNLVDCFPIDFARGNPAGKVVNHICNHPWLQLPATCNCELDIHELGSRSCACRNATMAGTLRTGSRSIFSMSP